MALTSIEKQRAYRNRIVAKISRLEDKVASFDDFIGTLRAALSKNGLTAPEKLKIVWDVVDGYKNGDSYDSV